ncbi:MFS transporter [Paenibacillus ginsengarvi]|uniref:MFS transporter n=1 Tax=Paenibacillus ginsengarvi TaxID=400777 RepID=A0A3B0CI33_9BACL|nr:MFS transporter [Paenibacillus ginsengarvi]RKN83947.1 MFS transporter [Paenibacillus ginsengarvi]
MGTIRFGMFFSVFVAMVGLMIIAPVMPPLVRELGLGEMHSGLIISLGSVAMAVMSPFWGRWSDKFGRRPVILAGFAGMFVCYALFTAVMYAGLHGLWSGSLLITALVATRALIGAFIPAVPSSAQAYMADVTDAQGRSAGMALIGAANGLGLVLGPAIAGGFILIGLIWPLYIGALLPVVAFAVVLLVVPKRKAVVHARPPRIDPLQRGLRLYLLSGLTVMLCIVSLQVVGGFYFQDQLGLTTKETARFVSFGLMISGFSMIGTQGLLMKRSKLAPRRQLLWGALLLIGSLAIMLLFAQLYVYYAAYLLFGMGAGLMMPGFMTGASLAVSSDQQGGIAGLVGTVQGIAAVVAPLLSTGLYRVDKHLPYGLVAVLLLVLAASLLLAQRSKANAMERSLGH